jgi:hypothetical protein
MRTAVCTESGLSTTMMRRVGFGGSGREGVSTVWRCQSPNTFCAAAIASRDSTSPTIARMVLFGAK